MQEFSIKFPLDSVYIILNHSRTYSNQLKKMFSYRSAYRKIVFLLQFLIELLNTVFLISMRNFQAHDTLATILPHRKRSLLKKLQKARDEFVYTRNVTVSPPALFIKKSVIKFMSRMNTA